MKSGEWCSADSLPFDVGTEVEVRCRFDGRWSRGFEVAAVRNLHDRVSIELLRRSDGVVLPAEFDPIDVRRLRP